MLVVDDEPSLVLLMRTVLEKSGHAVASAENGREALAKLGVDPVDEAAPLPDLVLLDVMMPLLDGVGVAKALKDHPRAGKVPILIVTAKGDLRPLFEAMPQVAGFFQKPFTPASLREAVARALAPRPSPSARRGNGLALRAPALDARQLDGRGPADGRLRLARRLGDGQRRPLGPQDDGLGRAARRRSLRQSRAPQPQLPPDEQRQEQRRREDDGLEGRMTVALAVAHSASRGSPAGPSTATGGAACGSPSPRSGGRARA
ncbi:MAG: response regulator [Elusimicrobiota bacterium]|nr:MAG: response regulator [Elusimicrobiota bacterium]